MVIAVGVGKVAGPRLFPMHVTGSLMAERRNIRFEKRLRATPTNNSVVWYKGWLLRAPGDRKFLDSVPQFLSMTQPFFL